MELLHCVPTYAYNFHLGKLKKTASVYLWKDMLYGICLIIFISLLFGKFITPNCISYTSYNQE